MGAVHHGSLTSTVLLVIANLLIPLSIVLFAVGFFPHKPVLPGLAVFEPLEYGPPPDAPFDKLVFMVVDALRSDFVFSPESGFTFTQHGEAIPFTANARSPTVTMPRIKAMTTGSIPSFVDLILNLDEADKSSSLAVQDTWLAQFKASGRRKLLMYGDDTWLKLFPDAFDRADGTTSFFVSDFTEVDNNVTRHISEELKNDDWGLMVLHYLGLDHIGHKSGPRSVNMVPKQKEMDQVVRRIFTAVESNRHLESTLLVLCGDHGMNDAGNHGASSAGETSPALVFMSPKFKQLDHAHRSAPVTISGDDFAYYDTVEQSDLAPTIAALLGFPVSKNNLGAFIPDFLPLWLKPRDKMQILIRNARQVLNIVTAAFGHDIFDPLHPSDPCALQPSEINELACEWRKLAQQAHSLTSGEELDQDWVTTMMAWLRKAQDLMSSMASNYDMRKLYLGLGLAASAVFLSLTSAAIQYPASRGSVAALSVITISYGGMMFASSYVEEEHHFWYWSSSLWLAFLWLRAAHRSVRLQPSAFGQGLLHLLGLAAFRLIRSWNQTGQKFAGDADLVKVFLAPRPLLLWTIVTTTYVVVAWQIFQAAGKGLPGVLASSLASGLLSVAFVFKIVFTLEDAPEQVGAAAETLRYYCRTVALVSCARYVFAMLAILFVSAIYMSFKSSTRASTHLIHHLYTLFAMTQSRATNIPLFLLFKPLLLSLQHMSLSVADITTTSILLQFASFFALGGSNAISSVDLSSAYNGISGFHVGTVGLLTFLSNWAGPIFWTSATKLLLLQKHHQGERAVFHWHVVLLTCFTATTVSFVMAACIALRTHLFVWTVFSPKFLYCMAWALVQHLLVNICFGGFLFWLGTRAF